MSPGVNFFPETALLCQMKTETDILSEFVAEQQDKLVTGDKLL